MGSSIPQMEKLRHTVRKSCKIPSPFTVLRPQIHSFCLLSIQAALSSVWDQSVESGKSDRLSHPPAPLLLWPGSQKGRLHPMFQFEEHVPSMSPESLVVHRNSRIPEINWFHPILLFTWGKRPAHCTVHPPRGRGWLSLPQPSYKRQ